MHECQPSHARCVATEGPTRHGRVTIRSLNRCASSPCFSYFLGRPSPGGPFFLAEWYHSRVACLLLRGCCFEWLRCGAWCKCGSGLYGLVLCSYRSFAGHGTNELPTSTSRSQQWGRLFLLAEVPAHQIFQSLHVLWVQYSPRVHICWFGWIVWTGFS